MNVAASQGSFRLFLFLLFIALQLFGSRSIDASSTEDHWRPTFHYLPPSNWMNDPVGTIYFEGKYHLFHQYNPFQAIWGTMYWGHGISDDLVYWKHEPIALYPNNTYDSGGVWSGSIIPIVSQENGETSAFAFYTAVVPQEGTSFPWKQTQAISISTDKELLKWTPYEQNPIIPTFPEVDNLDDSGFRDPNPFALTTLLPSLDDPSHQWFLLLGSGFLKEGGGGGGTVLLYRNSSSSFTDWEFIGPLLPSSTTTNWSWTGVWECPDIFPLPIEGQSKEYQTVLMLGANDLQQNYYLVGNVSISTDSFEFAPTDDIYRVDNGIFYAARTMIDSPNDRRILFGWIKEDWSSDRAEEVGWAGVQSIPRVLTFDDSIGKMIIEPLPELQRLRIQDEHVSIPSLVIDSNSNQISCGPSLEINITFINFDQFDGGFGLSVLSSPIVENLDDLTTREQTLILYNPTENELMIDRMNSTTNSEGVNLSLQNATLELRDSNRLTLHIFIDHSVIEVFAEGWFTFTTRVYPSSNQSTCVQIINQASSDLDVTDIDVWGLKSIWVDTA